MTAWANTTKQKNARRQVTARAHFSGVGVGRWLNVESGLVRILKDRKNAEKSVGKGEGSQLCAAGYTDEKEAAKVGT